MPLDPSIVNGYQPIKLENPMNQLAQMMQIQAAQKQNQLADLTMQTHQQTFDENNKLRTLLATPGYDATDSGWQQKTLAAAPTQGMTFLKGLIEQGKAKSDIGLADAHAGNFKSETAKRDFELNTAKTDQAIKHIASFGDPMSAIADLDAQIKSGTVDPARGAALRATIPQNPVDFPKWQLQTLLGILDAKTQVEMRTPKTEFKDNGQQLIPVPSNPLADGYVAPTAIQKFATPGEVMTDTRTRSEGAANRSQALTLANQAVMYQQDGDGNYIALPSKVAAGQKIIGSAVMGADGKPLQGNKGALNDSQSKAALFGSRMKNADAILADLAESGTTTSIPGSNAGWGVGTVVSALQSDKQQQLDQAKRDFVNAVLRRESGASISPSEFDSANQQYFPSINDGEKVKAQKANARAIAIRGMLSEIPEGQRQKTVDSIIGPKGPKVGEVQDGHRFKGGNPADPKSWEAI